MAKKYLTLQEAAERLGITPDELERERKDGVIRGFANRGSWKFRREDVEEFARTRETDSAPDIPLAASESGDDDTIMDILGATDSDSDVRLFSDPTLFDEDDEFPDLSSSDSDVRLADDSGPLLLDSDDSTPPEQNVLNFDGDSDEALGRSDSDVNLVGAGTDPDINLADVAPGEVSSAAATDADIDLNSGLFDDDDDILDSDSDVKLAAMVFDDNDTSLVDSDSDVKVAVSDSVDSDSDVVLSDSDSDVKVAIGDTDDDSDIILSDSDSDIRLSTDEDDDSSDSDSDLNLVGGLESDGDTDGEISQKTVAQAEGTESDIRLVGDELDPDDELDLDLDLSIESDDEIAGAQTIALPDDSDLKLIDPVEADTELPDSGITLSAADDDDSGISLDIGDSGISLEADDSGISLEADDSGISLEGIDSGFGDDSGISLDIGDSGIRFEADADSGISLESSMDQTMAVDVVPGADTGAETMQMDIDDAMAQPAGIATGEFDLGLLESDEEDDGTDTSILMFDDESGSDTALEDEDYAEDFDEEGSYDDDFDDDDFGEDEMDDVFEAEDDDDEGGSTGMTTAGFTVPAGRAAAVEAPWGTGVTAGVIVGSLCSAVAAFAGFELVRTMWLWFQPGAEPSWFLEQIGGFFV